MIGTIRKHSSWLWVVIIAATIVSFVYWGVGSSQRSNGPTGEADLGAIYGKKVTPEQLYDAKKDFYISYWFHSGNWPDPTSISDTEMKQQIYLTLMFQAKAQQLGIHASEDAVAAAAAQRLAALGRNGQSVPLDALVNQVLAQQHLTAADFESYIRNDLIVQQLIQTIGQSGELVTPQQAAAAYEHDYDQLSVQAVFFDATNYLPSVKVTPEIIGAFYTNFMAEYRLPDRVQVDYVAFDSTNYLAQSKAEWAKTNLNEVVEADLQKVGANYRGSKTPEEARAKITEELIEGRAMTDAKKDADYFAGSVFNIDPAKAENLAKVAAQQKLVVHQTAPFARETGPDELNDAVNFTAESFKLTADIPLAGPVKDGGVYYVIALARTLPSMVPALSDIRSRVISDYQQREAALLAQRAGDAFYRTVTNQLASGHSFESLAAAAGVKVHALEPFSVATQSISDLGADVTLPQIKQAAFTTPVGKPSVFTPTPGGGFILMVQARIPADQTKMAADLPKYTDSLRRSRENEAFAQWYQTEAATALHMPKM